jgi:hypothetical protein
MKPFQGLAELWNIISQGVALGYYIIPLLGNKNVLNIKVKKRKKFNLFNIINII